MSEGQIFDYANNTVRPALATVQGVSAPNAYGGKQRQVQVDLARRGQGHAGLDLAGVGIEHLAKTA